MQKKGKFIVFEGIDGCGKSTQIWKLARYISDLSKYNHLIITRNPYKTREIRQILRQDEPPETQAEKLAELFIQDRKEHIDELILPHLEKGHYVICDRYKHSTIAYQSTQGLSIEKLSKLQEDMPVPDAVFLIDTPAEIAAERMKKDSRDEQKFEANLNFQKKVRQKYLELAKLFPNKIFIVDGTKSVEEISTEIKKICEKLNI